MDKITYILPYVAIVAAVDALILPYIKSYAPDTDYSKSKKGRAELGLVFAAYILYIIFAVFKKIEFGIGATDAANYLKAFGEMTDSFLYSVTKVNTFEIGFNTVMWVITRFTYEYKVFLFFFHTLTFWLTVLFLRRAFLNVKSGYVPVFVCLLTLISQFNTMRMSIGIAIALWAMVFLSEKKWLKALLAALIASSMQLSLGVTVGVCILCFILEKIKKAPQLWNILLCSFGTLAAFIGFKYVVPLIPRLASYISGAELFFPGTYIAVVCIYALSLYRMEEMCELSPMNKVLISALPLCLVCMPLQYYMSIMYRLTMVFVPMMMALIPSLCRCYRRENTALIIWLGVRGALYGYAALRIYSFFGEEIYYIGEYTNTLLEAVL